MDHRPDRLGASQDVRMSGANTMVLLATLWQRTSDKGNDYLSGFLGKDWVIGFHGAPTADGVPTWDLYLQPGKEQEERKAASSARPASSSPRPWQRQRQEPRAAARQPKPNPGPPFFDDGVEDIGRGR
jgi:hypothetical protein